MNKLSIAGAVAASSFVGAAGFAGSAAYADNRMEVGAFAGLHLWSDNNELGIQDPGPEEIENSPVVGFRVGRGFHTNLSLEGELAIAPGITDESGTDVVAIGYRLQLLVHPRASFEKRLQPFALIGIGGSTSASSDVDVIENDSDFVSHGGVGFKYRVGDDWGFRFDARLLLPPARDGLVTTDGEFLVGFYKTFPGKAASKPQDPQPRPEPGPEPAPAPQPGPSDRDGDGLHDAADRCVDAPEDRDDFEDADGCPDPDNDRDNVPDAADSCPEQLETANGFQDHDGCPDEVPAAVKKFQGTLRGVDFATSSDRLTPASSTVLDQAVRVLKEYPSIRVEIAGHTDGTGDAAYNRDLSRRRAESVKAYFVARGIAADRLEAVGFGPDKPIADNASAAGRAKNRRVELTVK